MFRKKWSSLIFIFMAISFSGPAFALDQQYLLVQNATDQQIELNELGFQLPDTKTQQEEQKVLEKRAKKLKTHQILGLTTLALAAATAFTAKEHQEAPESHEILGITTATVYFTTAYFSLTAPETKETEKRSSAWNMKVHKTMAFIHFPAMVLLPFAGMQASHAYRDGKKPSGLGKHKVDLANAALISLGIAALSVTIDF